MIKISIVMYAPFLVPNIGLEELAKVFQILKVSGSKIGPATSYSGNGLFIIYDKRNLNRIFYRFFSCCVNIKLSS
jgi:hypothetical protein